MKLNFKKTAVVVLISIGIFSCSKSDDTPTLEPDKPVMVTTFVGSTFGDFDAVGSNAKIGYPAGLVQDSQGNIYFTEFGNHKIKKIAPSGAVSTFAGTGEVGNVNGAAATATFNRPNDITIDVNNNLFVSDSGNYKVRKITPQGIVSDFAGSTNGDQNVVAGAGSSALYARFSGISGIVIDNAGNIIVCDNGNSKIKKINANGTVVSTLVGTIAGDVDGDATTAQINPSFITKDNQGNFYFTDGPYHKIKKISGAGVVTTIAGSTRGDIDESGTNAKFNNPTGIAINKDGTLFVTDQFNNKIKKISATGTVTTIAGNLAEGDVDGLADVARFYYPVGILIDLNGNLVISDFLNCKIKKITLK